MITKEQREKDRAICEAATKGRWEYTPAAGVHVSDGQSWTSIAFPEGVELADVNGEAIANAVNRLPVYIADAEEMEQRIAKIETLAPLRAGTLRDEGATLDMVLRILRGEP